jgi:hypothetical protein
MPLPGATSKRPYSPATLAQAVEWKRNFGFTFEAHQTPISFLTRASKCLGVKFNVTRAGSGDRLYQYQAYSLGLIDDLLLEAMEKLDLERAKYEGMTESELDRIVEDKANKSRQQVWSATGGV